MEGQFLYADLNKSLYGFDLKMKIELTTPGDSLAILGPSGSGKSMALRMIAGLVTPSQGEIRLNHHVLFDARHKINIPPRKRGVGYVFQHYALFPHMTVSQNVMFGMSKHLSGTERQAKCRELLAEIRLEDYESRFPSQLSGGQQQRVALARALAAEPQLLLLDEPFSALDAELRGELEALLLRVREIRKIPYILVTHNLEEAYRLCDNLAVIQNGEILQIGPKRELLKNPRTLETAKRLGVKNLWSATLKERQGEGGQVFVPALNQTLHLNSLGQGHEFWLGIRPSEAVLLNGPELHKSNTFPIAISRLVQGVRSHTLYAHPLSIDEPLKSCDDDEIILEVPVHRHHFNAPVIYLPSDKLFVIPK